MSTLLLVGFPGTGKSTFLAALWHVLESYEQSTPLRLHELGSERAYLEELRDSWLAFEEIGHTPAQTISNISLSLQHEPTGNVVKLKTPDLSGEIYKTQFCDRSWGKAFDQLACEASGILLFVHPARVSEPVLISDMAPFVAALDGDGGTMDETPTVESLPEWSIEKCCTQVKVVDVLQFLKQRCPAESLSRIAVIVSAWDIVQKVQPNATPEGYVGQRLPLLRQFLASNSDVLESRIYGVSAQGGDLNNDIDMIEHLTPSERILVVEGKQEAHHDLTAPVRWLQRLE